jgi:Zn-dependent proteases
MGFTFHEYAHAYAATKFGDPTPERQGRLTVNPLAHIDIYGFILIIIAGFGWAKPVQTSPSRYKGNVRLKDIIVSVVGPLTNLLMSIAFAILVAVLIKSGILTIIGLNSSQVILDILDRAVQINCVLFIFNLIPIPPLDGFHVLVDLLPPSFYRFVGAIERYGYIVLLIFVLSPLSDEVIGNGAGFIYNGIYNILSIVFKF